MAAKTCYRTADVEKCAQNGWLHCMQRAPSCQLTGMVLDVLPTGFPWSLILSDCKPPILGVNVTPDHIEIASPSGFQRFHPLPCLLLLG